MWHSRDTAFALKCQIHTPPLCPTVSGVCCTTSPFCPRKGCVSCGLSCGAYFSAFPAERMQEDAMAGAGGRQRQDHPCWLVPGLVQLQGSVPGAGALPVLQKAWFSSKTLKLSLRPPGKTICRHPTWVGAVTAGCTCWLVPSHG